MTVINQQELDQLTRLDQAIMWAIISINASNLDSRNSYISDNAAIRAESKDYIAWSVTQDDSGNGRFVFSALLPIVNPHPLQDKLSLLERIWSYSPYDPDIKTESGIDGYGYLLPSIPSWADTTERLLAYLCILATKISKYAKKTKGDAAYWSPIYPKYWANCQYTISDTPYGGEMTITGWLSINWASYLQGQSLIRCLNPYAGHANDINCNFPDLAQLWSVAAVDLDSPVEEIESIIPSTGDTTSTGVSAEDLIDSYSDDNYIDEATPNWYIRSLEIYQDSSTSSSNSDASIGSTTPQTIESLTICKEQDPEIISFSVSLADTIKT
jgi:hypothetical protein